MHPFKLDKQSIKDLAQKVFDHLKAKSVNVSYKNVLDSIAHALTGRPIEATHNRATPAQTTDQESLVDKAILEQDSDGPEQRKMACLSVHHSSKMVAYGFVRPNPNFLLQKDARGATYVLGENSWFLLNKWLDDEPLVSEPERQLFFLMQKKGYYYLRFDKFSPVSQSPEYPIYDHNVDIPPGPIPVNFFPAGTLTKMMNTAEENGFSLKLHVIDLPPRN